jgi:hypothetical protein
MTDKRNREGEPEGGINSSDTVNWGDRENTDIDDLVEQYRSENQGQFGKFDTATCSGVKTAGDFDSGDSNRVIFEWEFPDGETEDVEFRLPEEINEFERFISMYEASEASDMMGKETPCVRGTNSWGLWHTTSVSPWTWTAVPFLENWLIWWPGFLLSLLVIVFGVLIGSVVGVLAVVIGCVFIMLLTVLNTTKRLKYD